MALRPCTTQAKGTPGDKGGAQMQRRALCNVSQSHLGKRDREGKGRELAGGAVVHTCLRLMQARYGRLDIISQHEIILRTINFATNNG